MHINSIFSGGFTSILAAVVISTIINFGALAGNLLSDAPPELRVGDFSAAQAGDRYPPGWQPLLFDKIPRHTNYTLAASDNGNIAVRAASQDASSGLTRQISLDAAQYPVVNWRWKVENLLKNGDVTRKSGDDYPARLYITFAYDPAKAGLLMRAKYRLARALYGEYPPHAAINYIWGSRAELGAVVDNPYTDRVKMFVLQSGAEKVGQWVAESRNIYADYRTAFGATPPLISGVAIMTDTDNTHESAVAWFGDIVFRQAGE